MGTSRELLVQEVLELTELLLQHSAFAYLRAALQEHDLDPSTVLLAGLIGTEDNTDIGVLILPGRKVVEFETSAIGELVRWETVSEPAELLSSYEAVLVGLELTV